MPRARTSFSRPPCPDTISTPLDQYEADVYELAGHLAGETGLDYSRKKNRVVFPKEAGLLRLLGLQD